MTNFMSFTRANLILSLFTFSVLVSCAKKEPEPLVESFVSYLNINQLMNWVIDPAADAVWDSVAWYSTTSGEKMIAPKTEEQWSNLRNSAATLMEASNLLLINERAKGDEKWIKFAKNLGLSAQKALVAIDAKNPQAVFDTGTLIDGACEDCHKVFAYPNRK
jgi:hypothetical protein